MLEYPTDMMNKINSNQPKNIEHFTDPCGGCHNGAYCLRQGNKYKCFKLE